MVGKKARKQAGKAGKQAAARAGSKPAGAKPKTGSRTKRGTQPKTKGKPKKPPAPGVAKRRSAALAKKSAASLAKSGAIGAKGRAKGKSAGSKAGGAMSLAKAKPLAKPASRPVLPQGELKTILQTASFSAEPSVVYDLIMDEKRHAAFTGAAARIGSKVGEAFSAYDGSCLGTHLELVKGRKIVQTWRESDWPEGHFSIATFMFAPGPGPESTTLTFIQTGVPAEAYDGIDSGWKDYYWKPMQEMLEAK
jgi:activator of HSP90 ATPase